MTDTPTNPPEAATTAPPAQDTFTVNAPALVQIYYPIKEPRQLPKAFVVLGAGWIREGELTEPIGEETAKAVIAARPPLRIATLDDIKLATPPPSSGEGDDGKKATTQPDAPTTKTLDPARQTKPGRKVTTGAGDEPQQTTT